MPADRDARLNALMDREDIFDLVRRERYARDQRRFAVMSECFNPGGRVRTSWYDGSTEDYTEASAARMGPKDFSKHWVFPAFLTRNGDKATVESPAMIFNRLVLDGVEVDFHVFCRFFSRVERKEGVWRLSSFEVLWERDVMRCVDPAQPLPVDRKLLDSYRPSYKHLSYVQEARGVRVNQELYGDDKWEELMGFHAGETAWLEG